MTISLIRTLILYFVILIGMRLMGKRQISELQTSELVVTLLISDIAAIPMQDTDQPLVSGLLPILVLIAVELFLSFAMMRSRRFRRLLCGSPIVLIENGKLNQQKMRELRITIEDLWEELRQKDIFALFYSFVQKLCNIGNHRLESFSVSRHFFIKRFGVDGLGSVKLFKSSVFDFGCFFKSCL